MDFFASVDSLRERWNVLEHSFYRRWSEGSLERDELALYAGEYRHAVLALAETLGAASQVAPERIRTRLSAHAADEAAHVELWDQFADALGADLDRPRLPETGACVESWSAGRDALERLVAAYTIESGQPQVAKTKLDGLIEHYGFEEGTATEYFAVHAERDHEHAESSRELIEERLADADLDRLLAVAEGVMRGNWELLDGVEREFGARG